MNHLTARSLLLPALMAALLLSPARASDLSDGYFLLHDICAQEKSVSGILLFKTSPPALGVLLKKISRVAGETVSTLDQFQKDDSKLISAQNPLPPAELAARKIMDKNRQNELLFGTKGPTFVRAMLTSQQFASDYAQGLAAALINQEKNATRRAKLQAIRAEWREINAEAFQMLGTGA